MSIFKKIVLGALFGFLTIFSLNKFVSADTITSYYVTKGEFYSVSFSGERNNDTYRFLRVSIDTYANYDINSVQFTLCLENIDSDASDVNVDILYCYGNLGFGSVNDLFANYNVNVNSAYVEQTFNEYILVNFIYRFDTPINVDNSTFFFYVGLKDTSVYAFSNDSRMNNYLFNATIANDAYNLGYDAGYNSIFNEYNALDSSYNELLTTYNNLNTNYTSLQSTYNTLANNYTSLQQQYNDLLENTFTFTDLFWGISVIPFGLLGSVLNFEVMGVNLFGLLSGIITALLVIFLIKKLFFHK